MRATLLIEKELDADPRFRDLSDGAKNLVQHVVRNALDADGICWARNDELARRLRVSKRTVQRRWREVEASSLFSIFSHYHDRTGGQVSNDYVLDPAILSPIRGDKDVTPVAAEPGGGDDTTVTPSFLRDDTTVTPENEENGSTKEWWGADAPDSEANIDHARALADCYGGGRG